MGKRTQPSDEDNSDSNDMPASVQIKPKPKRKQQLTAKAKATAAEIISKPKKPTKKKPAVLNADESGTEEDITPTIKFVDCFDCLRSTYNICSWEKYPDLTWILINTILENDDIRKALYPPATKAGESTRKNGGKPKTDYMWSLAVTLFTDHEEYKAPFSQVMSISSAC